MEDGPIGQNGDSARLPVAVGLWHVTARAQIRILTTAVETVPAMTLRPNHVLLYAVLVRGDVFFISFYIHLF